MPCDSPSAPNCQCPELEGTPDFPLFEPDATWVCIDPDVRGTNTDTSAAGCGSGCVNCFDYPEDLNLYKIDTSGARFLRPSRRGQNRNAEGDWSDLVSNNPQRVPRFVQYERAACWQNDGTECFQDYCECEPQPAMFADGTGCRDQYGRYSEGGERRPGQFIDCKGISDQGVLWPKGEGESYDCRRIVQHHKELVVSLSSNTMLAPVFHRDHACGANAIILGTAFVAPSTCSSGYAYRDEHPHTQEYYGDSASPAARNRMGFMYIVSNTAAVKQDSSLPANIQAMNRLHNAILNTVRTRTFPGPGQGLRFDQLDNRVIVEGNGALGNWRRIYNGDGEPPVAMTITAKSRKTGQEGPAEVRIVRVVFEVSLMVFRMTSSDNRHPNEEWIPYARSRIRAWTRVDHDIPVTGTVPNEIIYSLEGAPFDVSRLVEWRGSLGAFSFPPARNILPLNEFGDPDYECGVSVAGRMKTLLAKLAQPNVGGFPAGYIPALDGKNYIGAVTFHFGAGC